MGYFCFFNRSANSIERSIKRIERKNPGKKPRVNVNNDIAFLIVPGRRKHKRILPNK